MPPALASALGEPEWRHIGPVNMGGRVAAIVGIPGDPRTFWVGGADGGVWKTTNGGTTFEGQWQDEESYSVGALAVAPSDRLHELELPVMFIVGRYDEVRPETMFEYQRLIPGSVVVVIEDAGHITMEDQPEQFNAAVQEFLASVETR